MAEHDGQHDEALTFLEEVEKAFRRMIDGIFRFLFIRLWIWFYELFESLIEQIKRFLRYMLRLGVRLLRVLFFGGIWACLVFGPLAATYRFTILQGEVYRIGGWAWTSVCSIGSLWGLNRWWKQRAARLAAYSSSASPPKSLLKAEVSPSALFAVLFALALVGLVSAYYLGLIALPTPATSSRRPF
jgi:hypothetical protein